MTGSVDPLLPEIPGSVKAINRVPRIPLDSITNNESTKLPSSQLQYK